MSKLFISLSVMYQIVLDTWNLVTYKSLYKENSETKTSFKKLNDSNYKKTSCELLLSKIAGIK